jgi:Conserved protein/domain typically associated with flavoprotein oxygenases, DIM6/NTAB family
MSKLHWNPASLLAPVPAVLVSCGTLETPNVITIAWTGILCSTPPKTYISVRPERFSHNIIRETGEFVLNLPPASLVHAVDYCGVKSGRDGDKFKLSGLTPESCEGVAAPAVAECPLSIPCRVTEVVHLGSHDMFIADILGVEVDEHVIDKSGRLDIAKCDLMAYAHGTYFELGKRLATFGFSVRKKPVKRASRKK